MQKSIDRRYFLKQASAANVCNGTPVTCPATEGHISLALLHLGNISWRVGRELYCDTSNGHILHDSDARKLWQQV